MQRVRQKWCKPPKANLLAKHSRKNLASGETHIDDESPAPACTTFGAVKSRGEGTLCGAGQHSTSRLSDVVKTHSQADFMREVPLADNGVICGPSSALEKAYEETEPIHLVRCLCDGQTTREYSPE